MRPEGGSCVSCTKSGRAVGGNVVVAPPLPSPRPLGILELGGGAAPPVKVSLFLGAGASAHYLMPTTRELKDALAKRRAEDYAGGAGRGGAGAGEEGVWSDLLSDSNGLDIEHVLLLADTVDGLKGTEHGSHLIRNSGRLGRRLEEAARVGEAARREVFRQYAWDHDFDEVAARLLGPLVDMARALNGDGQVSVFTTNYDRAVEEFCEGTKLRMYDGFRLNAKTGRREWKGEFGGRDRAGKAGKAGGPPAIRLYKLHGSLDWKYTAKHGVLRIDYDGASDSAHHKDTVIHPSLADNGRELALDPYRTIHDSFRKGLGSSDACVVVGFSFRDPHIADELRKFAEQHDKILIAVGPDAYEDVHRRILGREPPDGDAPPDAGRPKMIAAHIDNDKDRRAVVIRQELAGTTAYEIAARVRSVIEDKSGLLPVHTLGECAECVTRLTIDDMEEHITEHYGRKGGRGALLLRIAARGAGAPWMLALAMPNATLGDLGKFLQEKWVPWHGANTQRGKVGFGPRPPAKSLDQGTRLSDISGGAVTAWRDGTGRLQVTVAGTMGPRDLREPVRSLAMGEDLPFE